MKKLLQFENVETWNSPDDAFAKAVSIDVDTSHEKKDELSDKDKNFPTIATIDDKKISKIYQTSNLFQPKSSTEKKIALIERSIINIPPQSVKSRRSSVKQLEYYINLNQSINDEANKETPEAIKGNTVTSANDQIDLGREKNESRVSQDQDISIQPPNKLSNPPDNSDDKKTFNPNWLIEYANKRKKNPTYYNRNFRVHQLLLVFRLLSPRLTTTQCPNLGQKRLQNPVRY